MIEFAQPFALWSGLAIALPILAHLAYRRIANKLLFPSLRFMRSSSIPRSGRRKPSDLWILLLRILIFVLITLLLADPYWREKEFVSPQSPGISEHIFLLDSTPSMQGWGAWEEAKAGIRSRIENEPDGSFGFISFIDGEIREFKIGTPKAEILSLLEVIQPHYSPHGLQALIKRAPQLFSEESTNRKILIFSDFQKSSWQEIGADFGNSGISLELCPVGHGAGPWKERSGNYAIIDSRVVPGGNNQVRVWSALRSFDENRTDLNVTIIAGGEIRESSEVSLPPMGTAQVQFVLPANDFAQAVISIADQDQYLLDNNQSLWILPPLPRTFGFWQRLNGEGDDQLEAQFLRAAMESAGDGVWNRWRENNERAKEMRIGAAEKNLDLLLILGLSGWFDDEGLAPTLLSFLKGGGKVFISPPGDSHVLMNKALKQSGLIDFTFAGMNRTAFGIDPYRIEVLPEDSKLQQVFIGDSVRDLYLAQIRQFINVEEENAVDVPLYDRTGRPLVLTQSFPKGGKLVFFTFRMLPHWTDLPMRNSFLPLLIELCELNQKDDELGGTIRLEAGDTKELSGTFFDSKEMGLFQVGEQRIEVVHPLIESMPEVINEKDLFDALSGGYTSTASLNSEKVEPGAESAQSLWLWFALGAAILLTVEMILSAPSRPAFTSEEVVGG
jgi:hypothetical protein